MKTIALLVCVLALSGCETYKAVKQLVQDVMTVPEKAVQDGKDGAKAVKDAVTGEPAPAPAK